MKLVAGLGNPGRAYRGTRHNLGFEVVDEVARRHGLDFETGPAQAVQARWRRPGLGDDVLLVKPLTFMNLSGEAVGGLARYFKVAVADVLIVCDDVNLELGRLRARASGTEGGHNGLRSVARHLGTIDYPRLRVGVGLPSSGNPGPTGVAGGDGRRDLADHVLAGFAPDEWPRVQDAIARAADAVETWVSDGLVSVMNRFNRVDDDT